MTSSEIIALASFPSRFDLLISNSLDDSSITNLSAFIQPTVMVQSATLSSNDAILLKTKH